MVIDIFRDVVLICCQMMLHLAHGHLQRETNNMFTL